MLYSLLISKQQAALRSGVCIASPVPQEALHSQPGHTELAWCHLLEGVKGSADRAILRVCGVHTSLYKFGHQLGKMVVKSATTASQHEAVPTS